MPDTYQQYQESDGNRKLSEVEELYYKLQGTFGGKAPWGNLDFHAQSVFVSSVNNIRAICSLGG